ncbi:MULTISPECIES: ABC transporter substrate-binding protein [Haematobacter]|uniref:Cysteine ABC transporter substrate-binding protein n=1 Tax=Haematobacter genomosp. 1 TaxID=366618 RepID=A0A212ADS8_9RHOB|nr:MULTISPECIES: ABC transporter substrate-binding protein [Haematobacter]OWJ79352.1 cysteine ABC transporter substrate-binding protein [Haematobacter genomosp. 1]
MTILKSLAILAGLSLAAAPALADQLSDIKAKGGLICGTMGNYEPFSFPDPATREIIGYEVDLCRAVADDLGVKLELKLIAVEARIPELTEGRVDLVAAALGYTAERAQQIDYSNASFVSLQRLLVKEGSDIKAMEDLSGKKVSAPKGSSSERFLREIVPQATILTFQDPPAAFLALQQSKVKALALSEVASVKFVNTAGGGFAFLPGAMAKEYWGLGLRRNEPAFKEAVNATLTRLEETGEAQKIFDKWFGPETQFKLTRAFRMNEPVSDPVLKPAL